MFFGLFEETIEKRRVCIQQMENCKVTSFRIVTRAIEERYSGTLTDMFVQGGGVGVIRV